MKFVFFVAIVFVDGEAAFRLYALRLLRTR